MHATRACTSRCMKHLGTATVTCALAMHHARAVAVDQALAMRAHLPLRTAISSDSRAIVSHAVVAFPGCVSTASPPCAFRSWPLCHPPRRRALRTHTTPQPPVQVVHGESIFGPAAGPLLATASSSATPPAAEAPRRFDRVHLGWAPDGTGLLTALVDVLPRLKREPHALLTHTISCDTAAGEDYEAYVQVRPRNRRPPLLPHTCITVTRRARTVTHSYKWVTHGRITRTVTHTGTRTVMHADMHGEHDACLPRVYTDQHPVPVPLELTLST